MYDTHASIETQITHFQHFETGFNRETGKNDTINNIIESLQSMCDFTYLSLLVDAIKYIRKHRGLRDLSYSALFTMHHYYPALTISILKSFTVCQDFSQTSIGSWKDVRNYFNFCRKYQSTFPTECILFLYNEQLRCDYNLFLTHQTDDICPRNYLSLAAKYVPRESKDPDAFNILVCDWFKGCAGCFAPDTRVELPDSMQGLKTNLITSWHKMSYRKIVSNLNKAIDTLEIRMCNKDWTNINMHKIPYIALELNRNNLIKKSENIKNYYTSSDILYEIPYYFLQNPWKIIQNALCAKNNREIIDRTNLYWKKYIAIECPPHTQDYYIPVLDLSPSMIVNKRTLCNAITTAMMLAAKSLFGNYVLVFSQKVVWVDLTNCSLDVALERILGVTMNIQGCVCCVMNLLLGAVVSSGMIEKDLTHIKIMMIANEKISADKFAEFQKSWSSVGKLNDENFTQIIF